MKIASAIGYRLSAIGYFRISHPMRLCRTQGNENSLSAIGYRLSAIFTLDVHAVAPHTDRRTRLPGHSSFFIRNFIDVAMALPARLPAPDHHAIMRDI
jgi:hypothetical protein